ncbi:MAG: hypothetical protein RR521_12850, partial [Clostridia bacterium]
LYSQGATNLYSQQYADNADQKHPAIMRVYVPSGCVRINQMLLSWSTEAFRAYETGAAAGGANVTTTNSAGQSTQTSSAGGGSEQTSEVNGDANFTIPMRLVSLEKTTGTPMLDSAACPNTQMSLEANSGSGNGSTGGASNSTTSQPDSQNTVMCTAHESGASSPGTDSAGGGDTGDSDNTSHSHSMGGSRENTGNSSGSGSHSHYMYHTHGINSNTCSHRHYVYAHSHVVSSHTHTIGAHQHDMGHTHTMNHTHAIGAHTHTVPAHQHGMSHYHMFSHSHEIPAIKLPIPKHMHAVSLPSHTHSVSVKSHTHDLTLADHVHDISFGIYEGSRASGVDVYVDNVPIPAASLKASEMDIVGYLAKDKGGKITRGTWHEIKIVPNSLTRIEANLFVQAFVQSVGGGDY